MLMETRGRDGLFRLVRERSPRGNQLRRRFAAMAGLVLFLLGLLAALGYALLGLTALGVMICAALALWVREEHAATALVRRARPFVRRSSRLLVDRGRTTVVRIRTLRGPTTTGARAATHCSVAGWRLPPRAMATRRDEDVTVEVIAVAGRVLASPWSGRRAWRQVARSVRAGAAVSRLLQAVEGRVGGAVVEPPRDTEGAAAVASSEGLRCNALGLALRRTGQVQQAAALHEAALLIFSRLGNRRAEALSANALGVAFAEIGDEDAAFEQFERARLLLHELGDRHWEGKVLANIGLAKHRLGRDDEAREHLESALANLSPETDAYRRVERRVSLAS